MREITVTQEEAALLIQIKKKHFIALKLEKFRKGEGVSILVKDPVSNVPKQVGSGWVVSTQTIYRSTLDAGADQRVIIDGKELLALDKIRFYGNNAGSGSVQYTGDCDLIHLTNLRY